MVTAKSPRVLVASSDTHVGPPLKELRPYCEQAYLDEFDAYANDLESTRLGEAGSNALLAQAREVMTAAGIGKKEIRHALSVGGLYDVQQRLPELDREGVAAEVIYHGTPGGGPMPLQSRAIVLTTDTPASRDLELAAAGRRIYNRWLADFVSVQPERHAGQAQLPVWDIEASVKEVEWAKARGLRGVNFPTPPANLPAYDNEFWDPLFAVCADLQMPLSTHASHPPLPPMPQGPAAIAIATFESPPLSARNVWHLIFCGAFDRHPGLTLVMTEIPGTWFTNMILDMESLYNSIHLAGPILRHTLNKTPAEYVKSNVYLGCSFMSRTEALAAVEFDLTDRVMWGSDYPHPEGTWHPDPEVAPITPVALANAMHGLDEDHVRNMAGRNMIRCYGLDEAALTPVAERIGPHIDDLIAEPDLAVVPETYVGMPFRKGGGTYGDLPERVLR